MSWLFGKSSNIHAIPQTTPLQQQRLKQIKSLMQQNHNVIEVKRDSEYTVSFQCCTNTITLKIILPSQFPNEKPVVTVQPPLQHPLVDDQFRVTGSTGINSFYMHSDLGKVIYHIVKEFKKKPPQFVSTSYPPSSNISSAVSTDQDPRPPPYSSLHKVVSNTTLNEPSEIVSVLAKLSFLQQEELERLTSNEELLLDYVKEMESMVEIQKKREKLVAENVHLARTNLELEPQIEDLKSDLKGLFEEYNDAYHSFLDKSQRQDEVTKIYNIGAISTNLRISVLQAEEESELIAEEFLKGDVTLDGFLSSFVEKRKECHLRRAKQELLKYV